MGKRVPYHIALGDFFEGFCVESAHGVFKLVGDINRF